MATTKTAGATVGVNSEEALATEPEASHAKESSELLRIDLPLRTSLAALEKLQAEFQGQLAAAARQPLELEGTNSFESRRSNRDNGANTGKTGAKDEGLVQEPQIPTDAADIARQLKAAAAEVETTQQLETRLSPSELNEFFAHAAANPWDSSSSVAPSAHIKTTFATWLGRGLARGDIVMAQPNLAGAYATEVSRDPGKRVEGLAVNPHKKPAGSPRPPSLRLIAELSDAERELRREAERLKKKRWRQKIAKPNI
jgi:hypothetical protein